MNFHLPLIQRVDLLTRAPAKLMDFYRRVLDLHELPTSGNECLMVTDRGTALIRLVEDPRAIPPRRRAAGLYHVAFLFPTRRALAEAARKAGDAGSTIQGYVDHGVSEALYLSDPDGNGLEFTSDKPHTAWPFDAGRPCMHARGLDLDDLLGAPDREANGEHGVKADLMIGHVHLTVGSLEEAEKYFAGELGLKVTQDRYPGALFFAKGDYHHHFAVNVWAGAGVPHPPQSSMGLMGCELAEALGGSSYIRQPHLQITPAGG